MSRLHQIKAVQIAAAEEACEAHPYQKQDTPRPSKAVKPNKPHGRLAQIKQQQSETPKNKQDNQAQTLASTSTSLNTLADYQTALAVDINKVAAQKDVADKIRVKKTVLPTYMAFVDDYLKKDENYPNDVAVLVMVWLLDVGEIDYGFNLALVLCRQNQIMPKKFDRDMPTFLCDFLYDWAAEQLKNDHSASPYLDTLVAVMEKENWDVHPVCYSKLYAMLAKHKERTEEYAEALALCDKAIATNPEKHGVKGLKERLEKATRNES